MRIFLGGFIIGILGLFTFMGVVTPRMAVPNGAGSSS
jgi:hypothetical protein